MSKINPGEAYRRNLPHLQPEEGAFFVTSFLNDALPKNVIKKLQAERDFQIQLLKKQEMPEHLHKAELRKLRDLYFGKFDEILDNPSNSAIHLANPKIAKMTYDSFLYFDDERYKIVAFSIMPNHAHLVLYKCQQQLFKIMHSLKRHSGREGNKILGRINCSFWQHESYDRLIRNRHEFCARVTYTLNNPVKAKIVKHWQDHAWTYLRPGFEKFVEDWVDDVEGPPKGGGVRGLWLAQFKKLRYGAFKNTLQIHFLCCNLFPKIPSFQVKS